MATWYWSVDTLFWQVSIDHNMGVQYQRSKAACLSTYYLEYGRHLARLRHRRHCAYAPTSNTASHDNHKKIHSWVTFSFLCEDGAPLGSPLGCHSSAMIFCCWLWMLPQASNKNFIIPFLMWFFLFLNWNCGLQQLFLGSIKFAMIKLYQESWVSYE